MKCKPKFDKKSFKVIYIILLVLIMVILLVAIFNMCTKTKENQLISINSADWSNIVNDKEKTFIYVGRDSCEQCSTFKPMLERVVKEYKLECYYFDTDVNEEIKREIIKRYNIIAVPSIVVLTKEDFYIIMDSDNDAIIEEFLNTI